MEEGPAAIRQLIEWGAAFDREGSRLAFTREGAHSRNRVLHAHGDSTGREIARTLYLKAASLPNVDISQLRHGYWTCCWTIRRGGSGTLRRRGRAAFCRSSRAPFCWPPAGWGNVFLNTTNPAVATGDGVAMAYRAGRRDRGHRVRAVSSHRAALEGRAALSAFGGPARRRGDGCETADGERFMEAHPPAPGTGAPRRGGPRHRAEMARTGAPHVFLDLTHLRGRLRVAGASRASTRRACKYGVDLEREPAPVAPAAHYAMGGVRTDLDGRTTLPRLFAAGEAACTGVHGANRLASNSLLEGVVFGARAGRAMRDVPPALAARARGAVPRRERRSRAGRRRRSGAWPGRSAASCATAQALRAAVAWLEARAGGCRYLRNMPPRATCIRWPC